MMLYLRMKVLQSLQLFNQYNMGPKYILFLHMPPYTNTSGMGSYLQKSLLKVSLGVPLTPVADVILNNTFLIYEVFAAWDS